MADFISCVDKEFLDEGEGSDARKKREDYLSWDDYFMGIALLSAQRSKDPSTQVGACIVDENNKIVGIGYNGFPRGCSDDELPWARKSPDVKDTKYPYVVHAEVNAILNSTVKLQNARIYVALFPCNECAKMIIQAGIKEIVYLSDKYESTDSVKAAKKMLKMAGVGMRRLEPVSGKLEISFEV
jgi:dCMP deaminase